MKFRSTLIISCLAMSLGTAAAAQMRSLPIQPLRVLPNDSSDMDQRVATLEAQVAALTSRLERAENAAREANFKAGAATSWIDSNGAGLLGHTHSYTDRTQWLNHTCENANSGSDHVPCSQITGSSSGTTSPPQ